MPFADTFTDDIQMKYSNEVMYIDMHLKAFWNGCLFPCQYATRSIMPVNVS